MKPKIKYPELKGKCKICELGCFRLEDENFTGIYRCEYFTVEEKLNDNKNSTTLP